MEKGGVGESIGYPLNGDRPGAAAGENKKVVSRQHQNFYNT